MMSDKLSEYVGDLIKIKCHKFVCIGEIVSIDSNTIVLTNSSINDVITSTKFLGIHKTLIVDLDIIKRSNTKETSQIPHIFDVNKAINVYTSDTKPPVIKKGGSSSAVHRNLMRQKLNSDETIHKSRSSNFSESNIRSRVTSSGSIPMDHYFNDSNHRNRKTSTESIIKEPSWQHYDFNEANCDFDFDSNLALFDKNAFYSNSHPTTSMSDRLLSESSDSGGLHMTVQSQAGPNKQRYDSIGIESLDFSSHDENTFKLSGDCRNGKNERKLTKENTDVFTELMLMGIIPTPASDGFKGSSSVKCDHEIQLFADNHYNEHSFRQQPDIVQEVTKSQLCNSELHFTDQSTILWIKTPCQDFQCFSHFWKLDNNCKFPVFSLQQRNKLFQCAHIFGYDIGAIAAQVGKTLSEFVINQVGGATRLNRLNIGQIPKIAVLLGRCQTSMFAASIARLLLTSGCFVIVYFDRSCHDSNEDLEMEIKLLNYTFVKYGKNFEFNFLTSDFRDLENIVFDYIITGMESESYSHGPQKELIKWSFEQSAPILTINPPINSSFPWQLAAFVGVPTSSYKVLLNNAPNHCKNGLFKSSSVSRVGQKLNTVDKKPDRVVMMCNVNLPTAVYNLLNLNYNSPFNSKNWIRLYRETESFPIESN